MLSAPSPHPTSATPLESPSTASDPVLSPFQSASLDSVTSAGSRLGGDESGSARQTLLSDVCTPSRARRYPAHLSQGLPRLGNKPNTSQYETMEDLLAAAGYSVTRVFTPEADRVQTVSPLEGEGEHKDGVGASASAGAGAGAGAGKIGTMVAGWFAHILPAGTSRTSSPTAAASDTPEIVEDAGANPFLRSGLGAETQATRSLRTHLMTRALRAHPQAPRATFRPREDHQRTITRGPSSATPTLRHATSAPSLPRAASGRRRGLPPAWREHNPERDQAVVVQRAAWSGGFVVKQSETQLNPRRGWFGSTRSLAILKLDSDLRTRSKSQPLRTSSTHLRPPATIHRARSAPRPSRIHVPAPAPPVRPSPVVQPSVVVCRSVSSLGSSSSVRARSSAVSKKSPRVLVRQEPGDDEDGPSCPVLEPEHTPTDGLPATPARPALIKQRSNGFLKRGKPVVPPFEMDDEPDLAAIIHAFRPPSASASPTRRQRSIRSLRALLRDPRHPDVPVVCVASPGTVSAGGPGRALWLRGDE